LLGCEGLETLRTGFQLCNVFFDRFDLSLQLPQIFLHLGKALGPCCEAPMKTVPLVMALVVFPVFMAVMIVVMFMLVAQAFLIWDIDGKPLPDTEAPLRLILTNDGEARQIHGITAITLVDGVKLGNQLKGREKQ
jgi:hypothetical protein